MKLANKSPSLQSEQGKGNANGRASLELHENPDTDRVRPASAQHNQSQCVQQAQPPKQKGAVRRRLQKQQQSAEDSVVLNEILSNYGNKDKIKEILEKNKQAKKKMNE